MALSFDTAEELIYQFCKTYPQALTITFNLAQNQEEIYGPQNTVARRGRIDGSYRAASRRADFALANCDSDDEFERSLRHEILGHFGINTFRPDEKRAVLTAIIEARHQPGLDKLWAHVDRTYPGIDDMQKAEEVFAFACEDIDSSNRAAAVYGDQSFNDVCLARTRAMRVTDLINLTTMVAEGLHDRSRSLQNFPATDSAQFKQDSPMNTSEYPVWLAVQPDDRDKLRAAAGQLSDGRAAVVWDKEEKLWKARPGCDLNRIQEWLPDRSIRAGGGDPESEFLDVLTQAGLIVKGVPVMNGQRQRVATTDDKNGKKSGVYCGYLDRRPAGWFVNYHHAESAKDVTNWTSTGGQADPMARVHIRAAAKQSQEDAARDRAEMHARETLAAKTLYDKLPAADPTHPYLVRKGIPPTPDIRQTRNGALVVPFFSADGNFKTLQYIPETGDKLLFKDAPKQGNFLVVGGPLEPGQPILYAEGYATARSLNLALDRPVVMTIDAGNMVTVAQILHQQFPGTPHVFLADFDHSKKENKGLIMATEAAAQVGGQVLYPAFTEAEIAQGFTDFNDLHQSRGLDAVRDQAAHLFTRHDEVPTMENNAGVGTQAVSITPQVRTALEKEWTDLQTQLLQQQIKLHDQLSTQLQAALKSEKAELKSQDAEWLKSRSFGERLAASAGVGPLGPNSSEINSINIALKQLGQSEGYVDRRSFKEQRKMLQTSGRQAIDLGYANSFGQVELAMDRDTWVREQAALRLTSEGLLPLKASGITDSAAQSEVIQDRVQNLVEAFKNDPSNVARLTTLDWNLSMEDHAREQSWRFVPVEWKATAAIEERAEAYAEVTAPAAGSSVAQVVSNEDIAQWVSLDVQDLAVIQAPPLREVALETMDSNVQSVAAYAQQIEAAGIVLFPESAPGAQAMPVAPELQVAPGAPSTATSLDESVSGPQLDAAPVAEKVAPAVDETVLETDIVETVKAQPLAAEQPEAVVEKPAAESVQTAQVPVQESAEPAESEPVMKAAAAEAAQTVLPTDASAEELTSPPPRRAAPSDSVPEDVAMDAINVGPRIGKDEPLPQASAIDKDALLTRITHEAQSDNSVLYKLDNEPAFVDRGSRLEMAPGAGQSDEKIVAALLTAARFYRGQIELTGSDAFKAKAIELIAQHQVNVSMKNPAQQLMLDQARQALGTPAVKPDAILGDTPPPFDAASPVSTNTAYGSATQQAAGAQSASPVAQQDFTQGAYAPVGAQAAFSAQSMPAFDDAPPLGEPSYVQPINPPAAPAPKFPQGDVKPAVHQPSKAAAEGVTGKVMSSGPAPYRFDAANSESIHIKLRTREGVQTFWGRELAGLLRDTRIEPGRMVTLQWMGEHPVTIKAPVKVEGVVVGWEDKQTKRNQWSMALHNGPTVRTGDDQGVKLAAYDALRFGMIQNSVLAQLGLQIESPKPPADGLFWMTPNGQGSAKAGDDLSAPRPPVDSNTAGKPVISSWSADGQLEMALFRGDGPYLQGVVLQGNAYQHVLVSLPGHSEAPAMVFNAITEQGLVPIGVGNGINRSGGEPVAREHIGFKLEGDSVTRIGKLDFPGDVPPALHARLGFDERWKDTNNLPKSAPAAAPTAQPSAVRPS